jgi:hypothetical protein
MQQSANQGPANSRDACCYPVRNILSSGLLSYSIATIIIY